MPETLFRRPLPDGQVPLSSPEGQGLFREALALGGMVPFFPLIEHFHTQAEPAYCGLGSLVCVLNALGVDPGRTWKGSWRFWSEDMLDCCVPLGVVKARGITLDEFACLARCNGLQARLERDGEVDAFRADVASGRVVVASYSRSALGQTGEGHFSPIGGWHPERDLALVLDVARFKYPPHWVPMAALRTAMAAHDPATGRPRGWVVLRPSEEGPVGAWSCDGDGWQQLVTTLGAELDAAGDAEACLVAIERRVPVELLRAHVAPDDRVRAALRATALFRLTGSEERTAFVLALPDSLAPAALAELRRVEDPALVEEVARLRAQVSALMEHCRAARVR